MRSSAPVVDIAIRMRRGDFVLDVVFAAREGITALFGRSGAGKSSVLGAIAGLVRPDAGHIRLGEATLFDAAARIDLPRHKRRVGSPDDVLAGSGPSPSEARFAGISILNVRLRGHDEAYGLTLFDHPAGEITVPGRAGLAGAPARIVIRGADVSLALERPREVSVRTVLTGVIAGIVVDAGPVARIDLDLPGGDRLAAFVTRKAVDELALAPGKAVFAMIKAAAIDGERGGS